MTCMHPYLMWNIGYPLGWSIVIGCLCLLTKALFALPMYWLIRMLAFHSNVSAVPISGCLRRLLLLLFIKLDSAPKCGVAWFIMKVLTDHSSSVLSWELLSHWLCASCQHHHDCQSVINLPQAETILFKQCYHQSSWKLSSRPDMHLIACRTKAHRCKLNVLLHGFLSACQIRSWKEMRWHHQCCSSPMFMRWSALLRFRIDGPTVSLGGVHLSMFIQMHSPDNICQES